jgi:hypothetical protein
MDLEIECSPKNTPITYLLNEYLFVKNKNKISHDDIDSFQIFFTVYGQEPFCGSYVIYRHDYSTFLCLYVSTILKNRINNDQSSTVTSTLTLSLQRAILFNLVFDVDFLNVENYNEQDSSFENSLRHMIEIIYREILLVVFQYSKTKLILFLVAQRENSKGIHIHFPQILIEYDTYEILINRLNTVLKRFLSHYEFDCPLNFSLPLVTSTKKTTPYVPILLGVISKEQTGPVQYEILNISNIQNCQVITIKNWLKKYKRYDSILIWLFQSITGNQGLSGFENNLFCLLSPIPIFDASEYYLFSYPTNVTSSKQKFDSSVDLYVDSFYSISYKKEGNFDNSQQIEDYIIKDISKPKINVVKQKSLSFNWKQILNRFSECYGLYVFIAPLIVHSTIVINDKLRGVSAAKFWINKKSKQDSNKSYTLLKSNPISVCNHHNKLIENIVKISPKFWTQSHPLLQFLAENNPYDFTSILFYSLCSTKIGSNSSQNPANPIEIAEFLKRHLYEFFNISPDADVIWMLDRMAGISNSILNQTICKFSDISIYQYILNEEIITSSNINDSIENGNNSTTQNMLATDNLDWIKPPEKVFKIPEYLLKHYYVKYVLSSDPSLLQNNFEEATHGLFNLLFTSYTYRDKSKVKYKLFDPTVRNWSDEPDAYFNQVHMVFFKFIQQKVLNVFDQKNYPDVSKTLQRLSNPTSSYIARECRSSRIHSLTEKDLDVNQYLILCMDSQGKYLILDLLTVRFLRPIQSHLCSGKHVIQLPLPKLLMNNICKNKNIQNLIKLLYSETFITSLKTFLLEDNEPREDFTFEQWKKLYREKVLIHLRQSEDFHPEKDNIYDESVLASIIEYFIYLLQITCFDEKYTIYLFHLISSLFIKLNPSRKVYFLYGKGSNSKTFLMKIIKSVMGSYCGHGNQNTFAKQFDSSDTMRNILHTGCVLQVDELSFMEVSIFKEMTSFGYKRSRALYQAEYDDIVRCSYLVALNHAPKGYFDRPAMNRMIGLPFRANYTELIYVSKSLSEQVEKSNYPVAGKISTNLIEYGCLFSVLHDIITNFDNVSGCVKLANVPECVEITTKFLQNSCDVYRDFIRYSKIYSKEEQKIYIRDLKSKIHVYVNTTKNGLFNYIFEEFIDEMQGCLEYDKNVISNNYTCEQIGSFVLENYVGLMQGNYNENKKRKLDSETVFQYENKLESKEDPIDVDITSNTSNDSTNTKLKNAIYYDGLFYFKGIGFEND